jgi:phosphoribosylanthranilate isomerase
MQNNSDPEMSHTIKICGLSTRASVEAALDAGADMIGLVRFPRSPRHVSLELGQALSQAAKGRAVVVALTVDPDDAELDAIMQSLAPQVLQLHGHESVARVAQIRERVGIPVMKAIGVAGREDLEGIAAYDAVSDHLLLDAKPPKDGSALPGGNGLAFDWRLIDELDPGLDFMLSGGLNPDNVGQAIRLTGVSGIDVSSGVESAPGVKDPERIAAFVQAARAAWAGRSEKDKSS